MTGRKKLFPFVLLLFPLFAGLQGCASAPSMASSAAERGTSADRLQADFEEAIRGFEGVVGVYAHRLGGGEEVAIRADETFPTASLVKVPILLKLLDRVEKREVSWTEPLAFTNGRPLLPCPAAPGPSPATSWAPAPDSRQIRTRSWFLDRGSVQGACTRTLHQDRNRPIFPRQ